MLEIQGDALLIGVQGEKVAAVDPGLFWTTITPRVTPCGLLHLDDFGSQPGQHLRTRRAGFKLREVEDTNTIQCFAHGVFSCWETLTRAQTLSRRARERRLVIVTEMAHAPRIDFTPEAHYDAVHDRLIGICSRFTR